MWQGEENKVNTIDLYDLHLPFRQTLCGLANPLETTTINDTTTETIVDMMENADGNETVAMVADDITDTSNATQGKTTFIEIYVSYVQP